MADTVPGPRVNDTDPLSPRPHQSWNAVAFSFDMALFHIAMAFISTTVVLPAFIATLNDSELIVGLAAGLTSGGWLLPQLLVASAASRLPRKKPLMVRAAWIGRPALLILGAIVWLFARTRPTLVLVATMATLFGFFMVDAVVSTPWFDILARAFPHRMRGRVLGTAQILGGFGGIGAGVLVRYLLSENSPVAFPGNYGLLFALAGAVFLLGAVALTCIREPESSTVRGDVPPFGEVLRSLPGILVNDRAFRLMSIVRILSGFVAISSSFFVLYATRRLGFSANAVGLFVSAQVLGSLVAGLLMGTVPDRWGPLAHIRTVIVLAAVPPALALCSGMLVGMGETVLLYVYLLLYLVLGTYLGSLGFPFFNWIMEHADEAKRPLYIGLSNTLSATVMLAPALGGWIVRSISYEVAFGASLTVAISAWALTLFMPDPRVRETSRP